MKSIFFKLCHIIKLTLKLISVAQASLLINFIRQNKVENLVSIHFTHEKGSFFVIFRAATNKSTLNIIVLHRTGSTFLSLLAKLELCLPNLTGSGRIDGLK